MRTNLKRIMALLLAFILIISTVLPSFAAGQPSEYSSSKNSGERDVVCTTLDGTGADDYYTGSYTYDQLSGLSSSALLNNLRTLMKTTHKKQTSYDNCRDYADETDCENGNSTIITLYTSYASSQAEYNGGNGWNREHVWPKSLGGFNTSGAGADLHHIRPSENKTNSCRGNLKYGEVSGGTAAKGNLSGIIGGYYGSYYEPLDNVKGDVARICLYVYVRYGGELSKCNNITNVFQSIDVLLEWCALDPVDTWEMGRNEVVEGIQGNRNVFIDYPEFAWLIFGRSVPANMVTPSGEASGNNGGGAVDKECEHTNTIMKNVSSATCGRTGYTGDKYCADCNEKLVTGTTIPATGDHLYDEPVVITPPTTTSTGLQEELCLICGYMHESVIPKLESGGNDPCIHSSTKILNESAATCNEPGYTGDVYCSSCGDKIKSGTVIPATGDHEWSEKETVKEPTTTEAGEYKQTCQVCGEEQRGAIDKLTPDDDNNDVNDDANNNAGDQEGTDTPDVEKAKIDSIIIAIYGTILDGLFIEAIS